MGQPDDSFVSFKAGGFQRWTGLVGSCAAVAVDDAAHAVDVLGHDERHVLAGDDRIQPRGAAVDLRDVAD